MIARALLVFVLIASLLMSGAATVGAAICPRPDRAAIACGCCAPTHSEAPTLGQPTPPCCHTAPGGSQPVSPSPASLPTTTASAKELLSAHFAAAALPQAASTWLDVLLPPAASEFTPAGAGIAPPGCGGHDGFADSGRARQPAPRTQSGILLI